MDKATIIASQKQQLASLRKQNLQLKNHIQSLQQQIYQVSISLPPSPPTTLSKKLSLFKNETKSFPPTHQIISQQEPSVNKEINTKIMYLYIKGRKQLSGKKEMLQNIEKLKVDGQLYQSHVRVILKEYLEKLRAQKAEQIQINKGLQEQVEDCQLIKAKYEECLRELGGNQTNIL